MERKYLAQNRIASHEYFILERFEAGIVLDGGEVKSIKCGNANIKDSFCYYQNGDIVLKNMHVTVYDKAGAFNTKDSKRDRKLLLHKLEIEKLKAKVEQKGLTLVPLGLYLSKALIKVELGLCQGKHTYDKKRDKQDKDLNREKERILKIYK